ncbi:hypothetical protein [Paenibacillus tepidiphilus]|uniref:DUF7948 domain-containing protein n=1 Tax=Paenibacillus tepidiphilus TaxID=2608683 RepID=UPI001238A6B4|nr:hypothetical protein [Paenibacillus tepidiphilus]
MLKKNVFFKISLVLMLLAIGISIMPDKTINTRVHAAGYDSSSGLPFGNQMDDIGPEMDLDTFLSSLELLGSSEENKPISSTSLSKQQSNDVRTVREVLSQRTENSKTVLYNDNTMATYYSESPLHYFENGHWSDINLNITTLLSEPGFDYGTTQSSIKVKFGKTSNKPIEIEKEQYSIIYTPLQTNKAKSNVEGNTITYTNAWNGADLQYVMNSDSLKMFMYLKNKNAPVDYQFEVKAKGLTYEKNEAGMIIFRNALKEEIFNIPPMWVMEEGAADVHYDKIKTTIQQEGSKIKVNIHLDNKGLKYPLVIDPTTSVQTSGDFSFPTPIPPSSIVNMSYTMKDAYVNPQNGQTKTVPVSSFETNFDYTLPGNSNHIVKTIVTVPKSEDTIYMDTNYILGTIPQSASVHKISTKVIGASSPTGYPIKVYSLRVLTIVYNVDQNINYDTPINASIANNTTSEWTYIAQSGRSNQIEMKTLSNMNYSIAVIDPNGSTVASGTVNQSTTIKLNYGVSLGGLYKIRVSVAGGTGTSGDISLLLNQTSSIRYVYDKSNRIQDIYFTVQGQAYRRHYEYDPNGNLLTVKTYQE